MRLLAQPITHYSLLTTKQEQRAAQERDITHYSLLITHYSLLTSHLPPPNQCLIPKPPTAKPYPARKF
jgi:hypothetical protein